MVERFLRRDAVEQATGLRRSTIYELMAKGEFPRPIKITGGRAVGWLESEIIAYQEACVSRRDSDKARKQNV
jgi:prophage regulatory protein